MYGGCVDRTGFSFFFFFVFCFLVLVVPRFEDSHRGEKRRKKKKKKKKKGKRGKRRNETVGCYLVPFRLVPAEIGCDAPRQKRPLIESHAADDRDSSAILAEDERQRRDRDEFVLAEIGQDQIYI